MSFPRYERYKDSGVDWLGEVPAHWDLMRLILMASINDDALDEDTSPDFEMEYVDISSVTPGSKRLAAESMKFGGAPSRARRIAKNGDILVSTVRTYLRAIAPVIDPPENLIASTGFAVIRPRAYCSSVFLNYALQAASFIEEVIARSTGVSYPAINAHDLSFIKLPLPPSKQDQDRIGLFLETETAKMDALIEEQRRFIELLKEKRQAIISHAVTKGLNQDALKTPSQVDEIGEIPSHWKILRVRHVSAFTTSGPRGWSERISELGRLFVQSGDLDESLQIDFDNCKRVNVEDGAESARTLLANGDIVVCITGAKTGNVAVCEGLEEPAFVNQHLCLIRTNSSILPRFLGLLLKSMIGQTYFEKSQYGMKQGLSLEDVREAPVLLPPISEQREILSFLDSEAAKFDELYESSETAIHLLQERRTTLISAAVTGRIDVRNYTPKEAA